MGSHLCAGEEVRVSLDPRDDLTQDYPIGEYVGLRTGRKKSNMSLGFFYVCIVRGQRSKPVTLPSHCRLHLSAPLEPSSRENQPLRASLARPFTQQTRAHTPSV